jgi:hypothetical protein
VYPQLESNMPEIALRYEIKTFVEGQESHQSVKVSFFSVKRFNRLPKIFS